MHIRRHVDQILLNHFQKYRQILLLLGPRQVGKTTVIKRVFPQAEYFLLDNEKTRELFERYDISAYKQLVLPGKRMIVLDEVQLLSDPGRAAKIIYDQMPDVQIILTGSSVLNIKNRTAESLAGRKIDYHLYPLTFSEYLYQLGIQDNLTNSIFDNLISPQVAVDHMYLFDVMSLLETTLSYGGYPHLISHPYDKKYLYNLASSVVFKDILELNLIEDRSLAVQLLKLLALQIGNLVNYSDLSNRLRADVRTVGRYIDIFEESFLIYRLYPYSSNRRDEIGKTPKIYFHDLGLRNALIDDFTELRLRTDRGALFENFIINEILRANEYGSHYYHLHYWRAKAGSEVDLVLQKVKELRGAEITFTAKKLSHAFINRYPEARVKLITSKNFYSGTI